MKMLKINSKFLGLLGLILVGNMVFAKPFVLQNNSKYDIYVRNRSNEEAERNQSFEGNNFVLAPGSSQLLDTERNYSMKTAHTGGMTAKVARFYDIPIKALLQGSAETDHAKHMVYVGGAIPICIVTAGWMTGWNFSLAWQKK